MWVRTKCSAVIGSRVKSPSSRRAYWCQPRNGCAGSDEPACASRAVDSVRTFSLFLSRAQLYFLTSIFPLTFVISMHEFRIASFSSCDPSWGRFPVWKMWPDVRLTLQQKGRNRSIPSRFIQRHMSSDAREWYYGDKYEFMSSHSLSALHISKRGQKS